tara:strand:- start:56 stop:733 length:678 start_codon:yes stop_codon:yes gene_type:complete
MAQNFRRYKLTGVGSTAQDIPDGSDFDSFDTIVGIHMANTNANAITVDAFITDGAIDRGTGDYFTYAVTVASVGGSNVFVLGGNNKPAITLYRGFTYVFDQSAASNSGHTLAFKTGAGGSSYTTGVTTTGTPGQAGAKTTIVVSATTPDSLIYYCVQHGEGMGNTITMDSAHYLIKDAPIAAGGALQLLDGGAKFVVQSGDRLFVRSSTASSLDVWVSAVDAIST